MRHFLRSTSWLMLVWLLVIWGVEPALAQRELLNTFSKLPKDIQYDPAFITLQLRMGHQYLTPAMQELINAQAHENARVSALQLMEDGYVLLRQAQGRLDGLIAKRSKKGEGSPTLQWQTETIWAARKHILASLKLVRKSDPRHRNFPKAVEHLDAASDLVARVLHLRGDARFSQ